MSNRHFNNPYLGANRRVPLIPTYLDSNRQSYENEFLFLCGAYKLLNRLQDHALIIGQSGSGKNKILNPQIASMVPLCKEGSGRRAIVFSFKGDEVSWIAPLCKELGTPFYFMSLNDQRSCLPEEDTSLVRGYAWDFIRDTEGRPDKILQQVSTTYPKTGFKESVWRDSAVLVTCAIIEALIAIFGLDAGLPNVCEATVQLLTGNTNILGHNHTGKILKKNFFEDIADDTRASVLFNVTNTLIKSLWLPAAHQYYTPKSRWLSLKKVINEMEGIFLIAPDLSAKEVSFPNMTAMLDRFVDFASVLPNSKEIKTFVVVDEFPMLEGTESFATILSFLRGKGVHATLVCQSLSQIKAGWKEKSGAIIDNCGTIAAFHTTSEQDAQYLVALPGVKRYIEIQSSANASGRHFSVNENAHVVERTQMTTFDFKEGLKKSNPQIGLHYYLYCNELGMYTKGEIPPDKVDYLQPDEDPSIPHRIEKPPHLLDFPITNNPSLSPNQGLLNPENYESWKSSVDDFMKGDNKWLRKYIIDSLEDIFTKGIEDFIDKFADEEDEEDDPDD